MGCLPQAEREAQTPGQWWGNAESLPKSALRPHGKPYPPLYRAV